MSETHAEAPGTKNRFRTDQSLRLTLERLLPEDVFHAASPAFDRMAERARHELPVLAARAERQAPRHTPYDSWGRRIDQVETEPAFQALIRAGQEEGLVALPHEGIDGEHARIVQAGLISLFDPVAAAATTELAMTDAAIALLRKYDPVLARRHGRRLTGRHGGAICAHWTTEQEAGPDAARATLVARKQDGGMFRLHGSKNFAVGVDADFALVLARVEGAEPGGAGLSLFLMALKTGAAAWNGIRVRRLHDRLGARALPIADIVLDGALAAPVGELGRGLPKTAALHRTALLWSSLSGPAAVGHLLGLARDQAARTDAFGARLAERPMHRAWMARIAAEYEAMLALCFGAATAIARAEHGAGSNLPRLLAPLAKLACTRQAIWAAGELLESLGPASTLEPSGIPAILRNTTLHASTEGTTSTLAYEILRAIASPEIVREWLEDIERRVANLAHPETDCLKPRLLTALETLRPTLLAPDERDGRWLALGMARTQQATLLAEAAAWRIASKDDRTALIAAEIITREALLPTVISDMELDALAFGSGGSE